MSAKKEVPSFLVHGASRLPHIQIDAYNAELSDGRGFVGDRASGTAFRRILESIRKQVRSSEDDPIGEVESAEISKRILDRLLIDGQSEAAGIVLGAVEEFAHELAEVIRRFLRLKAWKNTERIVVGGGLRASRIGELAIGRASIILKVLNQSIDLVPIRHDPDEAGLIGCAHLAPPSIFSRHDAIVAVDIGGANIRAGIVQVNPHKADDLSKSKVIDSELWRHADDDPNREDAVDRLIDMLRAQIKCAHKMKVRLAPFIGVGCPGLIREDGSIVNGSQNLPGDWEHKEFNLPALLRAAIPEIGGHEVIVLMHNDAVVQGLSERPFMTDVKRWGVMTIGTGLGNARFTNRQSAA